MHARQNVQVMKQFNSGTIDHVHNTQKAYYLLIGRLGQKKSVKSMIEINIFYHIINWSTMERIILIGHLSIPNFVIWTANWTFYKLIPLNCFHKIFGPTENSLLFPHVRMSVWLNCNGNGRKYKHIHKFGRYVCLKLHLYMSTIMKNKFIELERTLFGHTGKCLSVFGRL